MQESSPAVIVTELNDPTLVGKSIEVLKQDVLKLSPETFLAQRISIRLDQCQFVYHSTNLAVRARTSLKEGLIGYTVFCSESTGTVNGLPIRSEQILTSVPGIEVELVVAAGYESIALLIPPELLFDHAIRWHYEETFRLPQKIELLTSAELGHRDLLTWGRRLVEIAYQQPDVFDIPQVQFAAQTELIEKLLSALKDSRHAEPTPRDLTHQTHGKIVADAQEYANKHIGERIHVADICEAVGVSERTLQYAFKGLLGMSPMAYLHLLRLHRVRQALQTETQGTTTVTKEALRWGFWHFGDFSKAYKECFGEFPSDTLRSQLNVN